MNEGEGVQVGRNHGKNFVRLDVSYENSSKSLDVVLERRMSS